MSIVKIPLGTDLEPITGWLAANRIEHCFVPTKGGDTVHFDAEPGPSEYYHYYLLDIDNETAVTYIRLTWL